MVMKNFLTFCSYIPIVQLLKKFNWNILTKLGGRRQFSGTDSGKIANSRISIIVKKGVNYSILQFSFVL